MTMTLHIAVHPKAGPKKGTIKISPNKTLQSFFINVAASPKIHVLITAAIIRFNHSIRVLIHCVEYRRGAGVGLGRGKKKIFFFFAFRVHSPMFSKTTKRKIKQRL